MAQLAGGRMFAWAIDLKYLVENAPRRADMILEKLATNQLTARLQINDLGMDGRPLFWGECGEVGLQKLRALCTRQRDTHLVFTKWAINTQPFAALIDEAIRGIRCTAPVELIEFDAYAGRFVDPTGGIQIDFEDVARREWHASPR